MSRILKVMIVLLAITSMAVPVTVFAEDALSLSGAFRVRGFYKLNDGFAKDVDTGNFDQRLRIAGKISVAEGVSLHFRTDINEGTWGDTDGAGRITSSGYQWDRAYAQLQKNGMTFRAGQQNFLLGQNGSVDHQGTGFYLNTGGAMPITLMYAREDINNDDDDASDDIYGINIGHKTDLYSGDVFVVYNNDSDTAAAGTDTEVYLLGAAATFNLDAAKVIAELDYFSGEDDASPSADITGLQFYADASMALSETATLGALFYYAQGVDATDQANGDTQITAIGNEFNDWDPTGYGPFTTQLGNSRVFDFTGDNAGVVGGSLYTQLKPSDDLTLTGVFSYLMPEEDDKDITDTDEAWRLGVFAMYMIMPNTNIAAGVQYTSIDYNKTMADTVEDDNTIAAMRMQVKF